MSTMCAEVANAIEEIINNLGHISQQSVSTPREAEIVIPRQYFNDLMGFFSSKYTYEITYITLTG